MSKRVKDLISSELQTRYAETDSAIWVEFVGCDGNTNNEFRGALRKANIRLEIVKNSLFKRAVGDGPLAKLAGSLNGPAAIVTGGESLIDAAKLIEEWMPKIKGMRFRAAALEGEFIDESRVEGLPKMPTKADVQAKIAAIILSPGANLASAINSGGGNIAGVIKAMIQKLEDGEEIKKSA